MTCHGTNFAIYYNVPTNRTNNKRNQTLLILIGILLACILTLNASAFYSAENFQPKEKEVMAIEKPQELSGKILSASVGFFKSFAKKIHL